MTIDELASALRARKHGGYYMACCPVHRDRTPSLSIRTREGRIRLRCFAGCETRDILATIGLTFRDLGYESDPAWKQRIKTAAVRPAGTKKPLGKQEAVYRYTDEHGALVAEKLRFENKVFLWRRPQAGGGWLWKVDRAALPLYRLHEVVTADTVCLVEGEKDADNLLEVARPGTAVTTAPNGSKSWRSEFAEYFVDKKVWIVPDSDRPGREYAERAAKDIIRRCRSVRIVSVAPQKDVSEFLQVHTVENLAELFARVMAKKGRGRGKQWG